MPIKPENRDRYPKDWAKIRYGILQRARQACEQCGVENYALGGRDSARLTAIEGKVDAALATLKQLQSQPGVTTQQVIDALVAKLTAP